MCQLVLLTSQGLVWVTDLFSFSQLVSKLICSLLVSVLLQPEPHYGVLLAPHLGNEGSHMHRLIVPLTASVWINTHKQLSSVVTVQLEVMQFYLSSIPWFTFWSLFTRAAMENGAARKDARVQDYTCKTLQLQSSREKKGGMEGTSKASENGERTNWSVFSVWELLGVWTGFSDWCIEQVKKILVVQRLLCSWEGL